MVVSGERFDDSYKHAFDWSNFLPKKVIKRKTANKANPASRFVSK